MTHSLAAGLFAAACANMMQVVQPWAASREHTATASGAAALSAASATRLPGEVGSEVGFNTEVGFITEVGFNTEMGFGSTGLYSTGGALSGAQLPLTLGDKIALVEGLRAAVSVFYNYTGAICVARAIPMALWCRRSLTRARKTTGHARASWTGTGS